MALDIWTSENVRAGIVALAVTVIATSAADGGHAVPFVQGALAMARGMALLYGCTWADVFRDIRDAVGTGYLATLDAAAVALLDGRDVQEPSLERRREYGHT